MATKKPPIRKHILIGKQAIKQIMQENLAMIAQAMIKQIVARAKKLTPSQMLNAIKNVDQPGVNIYKASLRTAMAIISQDAIKQARREVPKAKSVKLDEFDDLPPDLKKKILTQTQLLVDTQMGDLEKNILFQYTSSQDSTDSLDLLEADLEGSAEDYIKGTAIDAGSTLVSAEVINDARSAFFLDDEVLSQIDAMQFVNGDPVTNICTDLNGVIFDANDPLAGRFQPPFHWNCKTYIVPILTGNLDSPDDIESLSDYANLESEMQFSESRTMFILGGPGSGPHGHSAGHMSVRDKLRFIRGETIENFENNIKDKAKEVSKEKSNLPSNHGAHSLMKAHDNHVQAYSEYVDHLKSRTLGEIKLGGPGSGPHGHQSPQGHAPMSDTEKSEHEQEVRKDLKDFNSEQLTTVIHQSEHAALQSHAAGLHTQRDRFNHRAEVARKMRNEKNSLS